MIVRTTSWFRKAFKKLPRDVKDKAADQEKIFRINPFDPRLDTHKLHGKYRHYWSSSVKGPYRVMFSFADKNTADFIDIGGHEIYK